MAVSNEQIDLQPKYDGVTDSGHRWIARWDLPEQDDADEWREYIDQMAIHDRLLEPLPDGAWFHVGVDGRTVVAIAQVTEENAPDDPDERDAIGAEVIGLVQGLIGDF